MIKTPEEETNKQQYVWFSCQRIETALLLHFRRLDFGRVSVSVTSKMATQLRRHFSLRES